MTEAYDRPNIGDVVAYVKSDSLLYAVVDSNYGDPHKLYVLYMFGSHSHVQYDVFLVEKTSMVNKDVYD